MGIIFNSCVSIGYNKNWQERCHELAKGVCKSLRNQQKFNEAKKILEYEGNSIDLLDLAALVSSTQSRSDITGTVTGNQFCVNKATPFPFSNMLGKQFESGQNAQAFSNAYKTIQSNYQSVSSPDSNDGAYLTKGNSSASYLPTKENFETAYRQLSRLGESVSVDTVLDQIEINVKKEEHLLQDNWRIITEKNIEVWSKK